MSNIAEQIAEKATASMPERIENELSEIKYGFAWNGRPERGQAYVETMRGFSFWAADDHTVVASAPQTWTGRVHSYLGSDVLDSACQDFDLGENARIDQTSDYIWTLSW